MKTTSGILIALPAVFCALLIAFVEQDTLAFGFLVGWVSSALGCVGWAYFLRREHRRLARACVVVGCVHLALVVILPLLTPAKTRAHTGAEPTRSSQQPPPPLLSMVRTDSLLSGLGDAQAPAAVAERDRSVI